MSTPEQAPPAAPPAPEHDDPLGHRSTDDPRGVFAGIAAYVLWGLLTVYWHELSGLPAFELIGQRIVWSALLLAVVLGATRRLGELRPVWRDPMLLARVALAAVLLTVNWSSYVWAVTHDNVVETALGYFLAPLGTVAIGIVAFGERLRRAQVVAIGLAVGAVLVLAVGYGEVPVIALLLATTWAVYGWLKRLVPLAPLASLAAETFVLAPLAIGVVVAFETRPDGIWDDATALQHVFVPLSGVVTVVPLLLFAFAARHVRFTVLGPLQYAVPTINFALGVLVYGEHVPGWRAIGFALVVLALVVSTTDTLRHAASTRSTPAAAPAE